MHDPMVVVCDIKGIPLTRRTWQRLLKPQPPFNRRRWPTALTIWHVEPDGKDAGTVCHPDTWKWHPHHWKINGFPLQRIRRRLTRCHICQRRMNTAGRFGYMGSDKVAHYHCHGHQSLMSSRLLTTEVLDRLLGFYGITTRDQLREILERPDEKRDQFLLYYDTWSRVEAYRKLDADEKWRAPNQHITEAMR